MVAKQSGFGRQLRRAYLRRLIAAFPSHPNIMLSRACTQPITFFGSWTRRREAIVLLGGASTFGGFSHRISALAQGRGGKHTGVVIAPRKPRLYQYHDVCTDRKAQKISAGWLWSCHGEYHGFDLKYPSGDNTHAEISFKNTRQLNKLSTHTLNELVNLLTRLQRDATLRVLVVTSVRDDSYHTPAFCGGADIKEMAKIRTPPQAKQFIENVHRVCELLRNVPAVTIAAIDGLCLGAGLELAAACDFRMATKRSLLAMPEVEIGLPSVVHARSLVNIMGWQEAKRLMMYATKLDAEAAKKANLLDEVAEDRDQLDELVTRDVKTLSSHGRKAMHAQKKLFKDWEETDFQDGLQKSIDAFANTYLGGGQEPVQLMNAWIEKQRLRKLERERERNSADLVRKYNARPEIMSHGHDQSGDSRPEPTANISFNTQKG